MLTSSNLKYFQADLQKRVIDSGRRLIIQRKSESLAEWQLLVYVPKGQNEKEIREEYGVPFIDNGPTSGLIVGRHIRGRARRQIIPFNRDTI
jgi:hypothetical protein